MKPRPVALFGSARKPVGTKEKAMLEYKNILFCTDFSEDAHIAFSHALNLAKKHSATLHIIHIPHSPFTYSRNIVDEHVPESSGEEGQMFFDEEVVEHAEKHLMEAYEKRMGGFKDYRIVVACGAPDVEIIRYAKKNDIDIIVMGALGKSDADRILHGSTLASVSKLAHCHVMAIRNPAKQFTLPGKMIQ
jgi:nucleotide-binding universal stress UspA family protein